jgi:putative Ca2+/H+ antiporter (TMEM165/GDT1 family)
MGAMGHAGSHDKDEIHPRGTKREHSDWRQDARDFGASFTDQCLQLLSEWGDRCQAATADPSRTLSADLDIIIFFYTYTFGLNLPPAIIQVRAAKRIGIEFSAYPTARDDQISD